MRDFLFYISCNAGRCDAELFGNNRNYDVAINDYTQKNINPQDAEYKFNKDEWKYRHIYLNLKDIVFNYKAIAIFDDDVKISTDQINKLFDIGIESDLNIWQASLTRDSYNCWDHLYNNPNNKMRKTNTIEIMMPFFSKDALKICWDSFIINYCAWGLDVAWNYLLKEDKIMVIDEIAVKHTRPYQGHLRIMPNGKNPLQEAESVFNYYKIKKPNIIF